IVMPGQICAVALCKSNRLTLKKKGVNLAFHRFPKGNDLVSSTIRKEWINRCKREDKFNLDTSYICGLHFTTNDYERDLQNELLDLPSTSSAMPSSYTEISDKPRTSSTQDTYKQKRLSFLQFDEVKVKSLEEYDVANDQVLGPHSQLQVVQARGLFSKWKQPVYIAFDQKVNKDILCNIISELRNISFNVVACVSDCGGGNIGL
ncbi:hypothetical protein NQ317_004453, partial [Molorchus minor]